MAIALCTLASFAGCAAERCSVCHQTPCLPKCIGHGGRGILAVDPACHGFRPTCWNAWPACCTPCPPPSPMVPTPERIETPPSKSGSSQHVPQKSPLGQPAPAMRGRQRKSADDRDITLLSAEKPSAPEIARRLPRPPCDLEASPATDPQLPSENLNGAPEAADMLTGPPDGSSMPDACPR